MSGLLLWCAALAVSQAQDEEVVPAEPTGDAETVEVQAAEPAAPEGLDLLGWRIDEALKAAEQGRGEDLSRLAGELFGSLGELGLLLEPGEVVQLHLVQALERWAAGDAKGTASAIAALLAIDPEFDLSAELVSPDSVLVAMFESPSSAAEQVEAGPFPLIEWSAWRVDGQDSAGQALAGRPALVQLYDSRSNAVKTWYLVEGGLPAGFESPEAAGTESWVAVNAAQKPLESETESQPAPEAAPELEPVATATAASERSEQSNERRQISDFLDTWVTTALEDTNLRAGPEHFSPGPNFVQRGNQTFFENYEGRWTDDISQSHLVLYHQDDGYFEKWWTEAAVVLQFTPFLDPDQTDDGVRITDDGSYVRVVRDLGEDHTFSITGYAVDASRFRLGYSWDLSYGGKEIMARQVGAMPGVRLQWQKGGSYAFAGAKTAISKRVTDDWDGDRNNAYYALLGGAGVSVGDKVKVEVGGGYFQQGQLENVPDANDPLYGQLIHAYGLSGQVAFRSTADLRFIQSSELRLYRNAPDFIRDSYISHNQLDGFGVLVQAEANRLSQLLLDPDATGATALAWQNALAGDVQTVLVYKATQVNIDLVYKDLAYILFDIPGFTSGWGIPESVETTPQLYGRFTISHYFDKLHFAPRFGIGLMNPASYKTDGGTFVQYSSRDKEGTPDGQGVAQILGAVLGAQLDISPSVVLVGELLYTQDHNQSKVQSTDTGGTIRVLEDEEQLRALGANLMLRARF